MEKCRIFVIMLVFPCYVKGGVHADGGKAAGTAEKIVSGILPQPVSLRPVRAAGPKPGRGSGAGSVSYTHLTLPTTRSV